MLGICLPFHYHFEIKESCSEIKAGTNVTGWKELVKNTEKLGAVLFSMFEVNAREM